MIATLAPALIARLGRLHITRARRQTKPAARVPSAGRVLAPPADPAPPAPEARTERLGAFIDDAGDEAPASFLGWFDSSHELRAGLQVVEHCAPPEGVGLPLR